MSTSAAILLLWIAAADAEAAEAEVPDLRCGGYCLYVGLKGLGFDVGTYSEFEERLGPPTAEGYSMAQLQEVAEAMGAETLAVQTTFDNLQRRDGRFACIAHINGNHFVNFTGIDDATLRVVDPPRTYSVPLDTMRTQWAGAALLVSPAPLVAEENLSRDLPWRTIAICVAASVMVWMAWRLVRDRRGTGAVKGAAA